MKKTILFLLLAMNINTFAGENEFGNDAKKSCTLATIKGDIAFKKSSERIDYEYATFEKAMLNGITHYIRAGHGVIVLEARENGKLLTSSYEKLI